MIMMLRRVVLILVLLAGGLVSALAQDNAPVMGSTGTAAEAEQPEPAQILVIGDALAGGLGAGLARMADSKAYVVTNRFNEESGLARPEVYDWSNRLPKILESNDFDAAVVMLGSNDRQQMRDGNERYAFGSAEWNRLYGARVDSLLDLLDDAGVKVYWIGLPAMGDADYDAAIKSIVDLQRARAEAKGATFVDMRPHFLAPDGSYTDTGKDDTGAVVKLRGRDGISFFKQGNNRMGQIVLDAFAKSQPAAVAETAQPIAEPDADPALARAPLPQRAVPEFGQSLLFGEVVVSRPSDISTTALLTLGRGPQMTPAEASAALASLAQQGSAAAQLFTDGVVVKAPIGRVDDFAVPPKPAAP
jgi:uncharacterized protein